MGCWLFFLAATGTIILVTTSRAARYFIQPPTQWELRQRTLISGFRHDVEICALLGYYAASCGNCLPTFRDNVSVPSSRVKIPSRKVSKQLTDDAV
jgi:hypothetical protein